MALVNGRKQSVLVHSPVARAESRQDRLAPRPGSLSGKTIALLDNTKDRVDVLLGEAKALLERDFPNASFRYFRKESVSGAGAALLEEVAACDAVITAVGD